VLRVKTDASGRGWGVFVQELELASWGSFVGLQVDWPIHRKEMWAVLQAALMVCTRVQLRWIEFESDNMMVVAYLKSGGGWDLWMDDVTRRIYMQVVGCQSAIYTARWIRGVTDNVEADRLSHLEDNDDWTLMEWAVARMQRWLGQWTVD
jgi:hypothetical protein